MMALGLYRSMDGPRTIRIYCLTYSRSIIDLLIDSDSFYFVYGI